MRTNTVTKKELIETFEYDRGRLYRREYKDRLGRVIKRTEVRSIKHSCGYCQVRFKNKNIYFHRLVWILENGEIPNNVSIDHINGDKTDNRIENLRAVSHRENHWNRGSHRRGKLPGCYFCNTRKMYHAQAHVDGVTKFLGYYITELEAHNAYLKFLSENKALVKS